MFLYTVLICFFSIAIALWFHKQHESRQKRILAPIDVLQGTNIGKRRPACAQNTSPKSSDSTALKTTRKRSPHQDDSSFKTRKRMTRDGVDAPKSTRERKKSSRGKVTTRRRRIPYYLEEESPENPAEKSPAKNIPENTEVEKKVEIEENENVVISIEKDSEDYNSLQEREKKKIMLSSTSDETDRIERVFYNYIESAEKRREGDGIFKKSQPSSLAGDKSQFTPSDDSSRIGQLESAFHDLNQILSFLNQVSPHLSHERNPLSDFEQARKSGLSDKTSSLVAEFDRVLSDLQISKWGISDPSAEKTTSYGEENTGQQPLAIELWRKLLGL